MFWSRDKTVNVAFFRTTMVIIGVFQRGLQNETPHLSHSGLNGVADQFETALKLIGNERLIDCATVSRFDEPLS